MPDLNDQSFARRVPILGLLAFALILGWEVREVRDVPEGPEARGTVEPLNDPQSVESITAEGLVTPQGTLIRIPYVTEVPTDLPILEVAIAEGVEVGDNGRVVGRIKIWTWCGNCDFGPRVGRIDLSALILAAGSQAGLEVPPEALEAIESDRKVVYTPHGMRFNRYYDVARIAKLLPD